MRKLKFSFWLLLFLFLNSCAYTSYVPQPDFILSGKQYPPYIGKVKIFFNGPKGPVDLEEVLASNIIKWTDGTHRYELIGYVSFVASITDFQGDLFEIVKKKAASYGANGLMVISYEITDGKYDSYYEFTGIAIRISP